MKNYILSIIAMISVAYSCSNTNAVNIEKSTAEATEFINGQFDYFTNNSLEEAKTIWSENAVLIGTDAAEYLVGWDQIKIAVKGMLAIENPIFKTRDINIIMSDSGDMASFTQILDLTFAMGEEPGEVKDIRNSGVIKKIGESWKIVQNHWSIGLEGQAVEYDMTE
jgi:ketosteroid isomerase-like protein